MLGQEDKIRLIHQYRTVLLDHIFDDFCRKSASDAERVCDEVVATAHSIRAALVQSDLTGNPARGVFVLALQQVVDSFVADLITDEAFEWLAREELRSDQAGC